MVDSKPKATQLPDWLLAHGLIWATTAEIADILDVTLAEVPPIAARWKAKHHAFSPTRGAYVAVPAEFRSWGVVPASYFVDHLMGYLGHPYYVGYLSAAEVHGAAHQKPQVFQIVTSARLADRQFEQLRIEFIHSAHLRGRQTVNVNTPTGKMTVSSPETTVLDLVANPHHGGGLSNIATIIGELLDDEKLDLLALARLARDYPVAVAQRAGWIIELAAAQIGVAVELDALADIGRARTEPTPLASRGPRRGFIDQRWNVIVNTEVESDL